MSGGMIGRKPVNQGEMVSKLIFPCRGRIVRDSLLHMAFLALSIMLCFEVGAAGLKIGGRVPSPALPPSAEYSDAENTVPGMRRQEKSAESRTEQGGNAARPLASTAVVRVQVVTTGGTAPHFEFSQTNLFSTPAAIDTATARQASPARPEAIAVNTLGKPVTLTLSPPPTARLLGALCTDARRTSSGRPASLGVLVDHTLTLPSAQVVAGADITCVFTSSARTALVGRLFNDDGAGGGIANDSLPNGMEAGRAGQAVALTDCAEVTYQTETSGADGRFALDVPPRLRPGAPLCFILAPARDRFSTGASIDATALASGVPFTAAGMRYRYGRSATAERVEMSWQGRAAVPAGATVQFGSVPASRFEPHGGVKSGQAGGTVLHGHVFTAGTAGSLSFSVPAAVAVPQTPGWAERVFADPGCSGTLQADADRLFPPASPRSLAAGERLCVLLQETIPAGAPDGSRNTTRLQARLGLSDAPHGLSSWHALEDVTSVLAGPLQLEREVRNLTRGDGAFSASQPASPGDTLEYRIRFRNPAPAPLGRVVIDESVGSHNTFVSASAGETPPGLHGCAKTTPASTTPVDCAVAQPPGGKGALHWTFAGGLPPGGGGSVLYRVVVD